MRSNEGSYSIYCPHCGGPHSIDAALYNTEMHCNHCERPFFVHPKKDDFGFVAVVAPQNSATALKDTNPKSAVGEKKVPLDLCSPIAEAHWALAQFAGLTKYGAWNWRAAGVSCSTYTRAIRRHLAAYISGEELDPLDGTHHLGNIMACCAILLEADTMNLMHDDRPPSFSIRGTYSFVEQQMEVLKVKYKDMSPRHYTIDDTPANEGSPSKYPAA